MKNIMKKTFLVLISVLTILGFTSTALAATEVEPNNDEKTATVLNLNESITGTIDDELDFDVYAITVKQGGELDLLLTPPDDLDLTMEIYDENLEFLFDVDYGDKGEEESEFEPFMEPGKYYIVVYDVNDDVSTKPYTLKTEINEVPSPEVTNVVVTPNVFTNNSKNTLKIQYKVDTDSYMFAVVKDAKGNVVSTIKAEKPEGAGYLVWNGLTGTGTTAVSGKYTVSVYAVDYYYGNTSEIVTKDLTITKVITKINKKGSAKIANAKVLTSPVSTAKAVATLAKGTKFTVLEQDGNWYKVKLANGKVGYIIKTNVTL